MLSAGYQYLILENCTEIDISNTYLPADLHGRVHDHVGFVKGLTLRLALVLPQFLHG